VAKVIIFSDLHAHQWQEFSTLVDYRGEKINSRLAAVAGVIDRVGRYAKEHGVCIVCFAGDLFHRKRLIDVPVFNVIAQAIHRLSQNVSELLLVVGNHDLVRRSAHGVFSEEHALSALGRYSNVTILDRPWLFRGIGVVPYADDLATIKAGIKEVKGASWLILHAGIHGAHTGAVEYQPLEPLGVDDLPGVPIYSGHYHRPQKIARDGCPPVVYVGAPFEFVRGDGHSRHRGFIVVDTDNPEQYQRVRIPGPQFVTMNVAAFSDEEAAGNYVDLTLDDKSSPDKWAKRLAKAGVAGFNIVPYREPERPRPRLKTKAKRGEGLPSISELCESYADNVKGLSKIKLKQVLRKAFSHVDD